MKIILIAFALMGSIAHAQCGSACSTAPDAGFAFKDAAYAYGTGVVPTIAQVTAGAGDWKLTGVVPVPGARTQMTPGYDESGFSYAGIHKGLEFRQTQSPFVARNDLIVHFNGTSAGFDESSSFIQADGLVNMTYLVNRFNTENAFIFGRPIFSYTTQYGIEGGQIQKSRLVHECRLMNGNAQAMICAIRLEADASEAQKHPDWSADNDHIIAYYGYVATTSLSGW